MTIAEALYHLEAFRLDPANPEQAALSQVRQRMREMRDTGIIAASSRVSNVIAKAVRTYANRETRDRFHLSELG